MLVSQDLENIIRRINMKKNVLIISYISLKGYYIKGCRVRINYLYSGFY